MHLKEKSYSDQWREILVRRPLVNALSALSSNYRRYAEEWKDRRHCLQDYLMSISLVTCSFLSLLECHSNED